MVIHLSWSWKQEWKSQPSLSWKVALCKSLYISDQRFYSLIWKKVFRQCPAILHKSTHAPCHAGWAEVGCDRLCHRCQFTSLHWTWQRLNLCWCSRPVLCCEDNWEPWYWTKNMTDCLRCLCDSFHPSPWEPCHGIYSHIILLLSHYSHSRLRLTVLSHPVYSPRHWRHRENKTFR